MNTKTCVKCVHENEEHFTYCRYCGALLPVVDRQPESSPSHETDRNIAQEEEVGINRFEYRRYVGKNSDSIVSAFEDMQARGKKTSFCSPVFFLGIFFGFYGMSAWFLSRRMKKVGFLLLLLGVLFTFADSFLNMGLNREFYSLLTRYLSESLTSSSEIAYSIQMYSYEMLSISGYVSFLCSFIAGFFALHIYKNKVTADILRIKAVHAEDTRIPLDLRLKWAGDRRDGMVFIPLIVSVLSNILAFAVTVI